MTVPPDILTQLEEDRDNLANQEIFFSVITPGDPSLVTLGHFPKRPNGVKVYKQTAKHVGDSILAMHDKSRHFDWLILFGWYDMAARVKEGVNRQLLAAPLKYADSISMKDVHELLLVSTQEVQVVEPPQAMVLFSTLVLPAHVVSTVQVLGPIKASSVTGEPGRLIVTYENAQSGTIAYGVVLPTQSPSPIQITSGSNFSDKEHALSFRPEGMNRSLDHRIKQVESVIPNRLTLTKENLDAETHKVPLSVHRVKDMVNQ